MLDINFIRANPEEVKKGIAKKLADPALVDRVIELDADRRRLLAAVEEKQARLNTLSEEIAVSHGQQKIDRIKEATPLSAAVKELRPELEKTESEWRAVLLAIPNLPAPDVPAGQSDRDNQEVRRVGRPPSFSFTPKSHEQLFTDLDLADWRQAARVAGHKFYYLKGPAVILELALLRFALDHLMKKGFLPLTPPDLVKEEAMIGVAHFPPADDAYAVATDQLYLAGTAEVGLVNWHAGQSLSSTTLPRRYAGLSTCFRREAGAHGQKGSGLYRVHQFNKVEMVSFAAPEQGEQEHAFLLAAAEEILAALELHYRVVLNCGGDLGLPQNKKWDIECFIPSMNDYGETNSCSYDTDYQARRLNIKIKGAGFVHTLNNTAVASPRLLIPLLEQHQRADGSVAIPKALQPYTGFAEIKT